MIRFQPDPATNDAAILLDFFDDAAHQVHRDSESNPFCSGVLCQHGGVDADQFASAVDQCATRIAFIDRRIRLDEVFEGKKVKHPATSRADDALGYGFTQTIWIANRQYDVADAQLVRPAKRNRRQRAQIDLEKRKIRFPVDANHIRIRNAPVSQLQTNLRRVGDYMKICNEVALRIDDHRRAEAGVELEPA